MPLGKHRNSSFVPTTSDVENMYEPSTLSPPSSPFYPSNFSASSVGPTRGRPSFSPYELQYGLLPPPVPTSIHPALSLTSPLIYDVSMQPSARQLLLHNPGIALSEPAMQPPLPQMNIIHPLLLWTIEVTSKPATYVSVADVLEAIYRTLSIQATQAEFNIPPKEIRDRIAVAYSQRCDKLISHGYVTEKSKGLKRVDFLLETTVFAGLSSTMHGPHVWELHVNPTHGIHVQQRQKGADYRSFMPSVLSPPDPPLNQGMLRREMADSPADQKGVGRKLLGTSALVSLLHGQGKEMTNSPPAHHGALGPITTAPLPLSRSSTPKSESLDSLKHPPADALQHPHRMNLPSMPGDFVLEHDTDEGEHQSIEGNAGDGEEQSLEDKADHGEGQSRVNDSQEDLLEDEAGEAAFVVCWPQGRSTPSR